PPPRPIAIIDLEEFFLGLDKKWRAGGMALACGAGSLSIRDLSEGTSSATVTNNNSSGGGGESKDPGSAASSERSLSEGNGGRGGRGGAPGGHREDEGVELVSPLMARRGGGHGCRDGLRGGHSMHPGWGFGYNGPDPRVGFEPRVWYDMHMATDYKRCSVFLSDIRVVALATGLSGLKSFFLEPIQEFRERDRMLRPHRYVEVRPNNTDVEVVLANAYLCLPESQWDCYGCTSAGGSGSDGGGGGVGSGPAVVAHADLTLTQLWRGMPQV
ncbi:unnamed protein product, partial [Hapterophycus canaliculatus]